MSDRESEEADQRRPERIVVRRRKHDPGSRIVFGVILISLGVFTLLQQITHVSFSFVPLVIGIAFLAGWSRNKSYGFLLPGCILTGLGLGWFVGSFVPGQYSGLLTLGGLGLAFAVTGLLSKRRGWHWEFIVAAGLLFSAIVSNSWIAFSPDIARVALPVSVIAIGLLLVFRSNMPRRVWQAAISVSLVAALLMLSANGFDPFPDLEGLGGKSVEFTREIQVPPTDAVEVPPFSKRGLTLTSKAIDVEIVPAEIEAVGVSVHAKAKSLTEAERLASAQQVSVSQSQNGFNVRIDGGRVLLGESVLASISVPPSMEVSLVTISGDVNVRNVRFGRFAASTTSGDIAFSGSAGKVVLTTVSGDIASEVDGRYEGVYLHTASGDIALTIGQDPSISVTTGSGDIVVRGFGVTGGFEKSFQRSGSDGSLEVRTASGDVVITGTGKTSPPILQSPTPSPEPSATVTATSA